MISSLGGGMQLLLHGWLAVEWGHSPIFLAIFAAARIGPKLLLTVPAGIICDRMPRTRIMAVARTGYAVASLIPLVGLFGPLPIAWLLAGVVLAGTIHAFDLSSSRAAFGDIIERDDMHAAVAINKAASQVSSLIGPAVAFALMSYAGSGAALAVSATLLLAGALAIVPVPSIAHALTDQCEQVTTGGLFRYLRESPVAVMLILVGIVPTFTDKVVALLLPSVGGGDGTVSMALVAPELGALVAAAVLAVAPVRLGVHALVALGFLYVGLIATASVQAGQAEALVLALAFAGMASAALNTTTHANLQRLVPAEMRGRVFAM
jgi:MFS family permease